MKFAKGIAFGYCGECENVHLALWMSDGDDRIETALPKEMAEAMFDELKRFIEHGARKEAGWVAVSKKMMKQ